MSAGQIVNARPPRRWWDSPVAFWLAVRVVLTWLVALRFGLSPARAAAVSSLAHGLEFLIGFGAGHGWWTIRGFEDLAGDDGERLEAVPPPVPAPAPALPEWVYDLPGWDLLAVRTHFILHRRARVFLGGAYAHWYCGACDGLDKRAVDEAERRVEVSDAAALDDPTRGGR